MRDNNLAGEDTTIKQQQEVQESIQPTEDRHRYIIHLNIQPYNLFNRKDGIMLSTKDNQV